MPNNTASQLYASATAPPPQRPQPTALPPVPPLGAPNIHPVNLPPPVSEDDDDESEPPFVLQAERHPIARKIHHAAESLHHNAAVLRSISALYDMWPYVTGGLLGRLLTGGAEVATDVAAPEVAAPMAAAAEAEPVIQKYAPTLLRHLADMYEDGAKYMGRDWAEQKAEQLLEHSARGVLGSWEEDAVPAAKAVGEAVKSGGRHYAKRAWDAAIKAANKIYDVTEGFGS